MKRLLLAAAVGVVLVANGWSVLLARRNQSEPFGGRMELTERELRLQAMAVESTATVLRLNWNAPGAGDKEHGPVAWLDAAKLAELGFDCRVPLSSPGARRHYAAMPSRPVFLVLEYKGDNPPSAGSSARAKSHIWVVDAGRDPRRLRGQYPDTQHYIICRGLVRLSFRDREAGEGASAVAPLLEGWVADVCPREIFVPLPFSRVLRTLRRTGPEGADASGAGEPRYAVQVCWGKNYEPWVEGVRLLSGGHGR